MHRINVGADQVIILNQELGFFLLLLQHILNSKHIGIEKILYSPGLFINTITLLKRFKVFFKVFRFYRIAQVPSNNL